MSRLREPSTWAGLAAIVGGVSQILHLDPQTSGAVVTMLASLGVLLRERGGRP